ncbi:MAG: ABC transporter permease [Chitinophagales bacterium]|nr:ABC transporter permease [Chitinophagales bacterium]MDW8419191.1 ABC transporter permease [Chitinophagales bacterium]
METTAPDKPVKVITPDPLSIAEYWRELKKYRSLIWVFAWQEIKTQYAQTLFGVAWIVLRPLIILTVFTILFNYLLHIQTRSPYFLFAFCGMIAWNFFQNIANNASTAILQRQYLIRKMYFPKMVLPLAKVLVAGVELLASLLILCVMMLIARHAPGWGLFLLPVFIALNIFCGLAVALWMNALNIRYRDLNQVVQPLIGIAIWFTPVFFPTTIIPPSFYFLAYLNPIAGVIEGYRYALLGEPFPDIAYFPAMIFTVCLALAGAWYLTRVEDEIVDYA